MHNRREEWYRELSEAFSAIVPTIRNGERVTELFIALNHIQLMR